MDKHVGKGLRIFLYVTKWTNICFLKLKLFVVTTEDVVLLGEEAYPIERQTLIPEWVLSS